MTLEEQFIEACTTRSDIYEHLPVLAQLASESKTIIELGTRGGCSTIAFLYGLGEAGRLWSVDIDPAPEFAADNWTFIQGDDLDVEVFGQLPDDVDVVFIDTSHGYAQTLAELNLYKWKVRPGGKIVLHDTELARPLGEPRLPAFPVKTAIEEFCNEEGLTWSNRPNCWGLGTVQF
jgi:predicted O-methyltransferase YrrM